MKLYIIAAASVFTLLCGVVFNVLNTFMHAWRCAGVISYLTDIDRLGGFNAEAAARGMQPRDFAVQLVLGSTYYQMLFGGIFSAIVIFVCAFWLGGAFARARGQSAGTEPLA